MKAFDLRNIRSHDLVDSIWLKWVGMSLIEELCLGYKRWKFDFLKVSYWVVFNTLPLKLNLIFILQENENSKWIFRYENIQLHEFLSSHSNFILALNLFQFYQLIHTLATCRRPCSSSIFTDDYWIIPNQLYWKEARRTCLYQKINI